jgi:hypothetical protein
MYVRNIICHTAFQHVPVLTDLSSQRSQFAADVRDPEPVLTCAFVSVVYVCISHCVVSAARCYDVSRSGSAFHSANK